MKPTGAAISGVLCILVTLFALLGCATIPRNRDIAVEYFNLGNAYSGLGQFDKAAQHYRDAIRMDPGVDKARYNLATALIQLKKTAEAEGILTDLLAKDPKNVTVMAMLGWALHADGKDADALLQYDAILKLSPENQDAWYNSALILWKLDRKEEALQRLTQLLALAPADGYALYGAGSLLLSFDQPEKALEYFDRYLQKKPDDVDVQLLLADCYERLEKYSQALDAYDRAGALDVKDSRAWFGKARLLLTVIEDPDKGLSALKQALELGFHDTEAVKVLLSSPLLQNRDQVEAALKTRGMLPQAQPASEPASGGTQPKG
jgi:tetratricopeptide (TPR) repeat protein